MQVKMNDSSQIKQKKKGFHTIKASEIQVS